MNKITFAGKIADFNGERKSKCYEIIVPAVNGGGRLVSENFSHGYGWGEIILIPPNFTYSLEGAHPDDLHILIERATLSLRQPDIMTDIENDGIRHAAIQAEAFFNSDWANKQMVLSALGNLLVSYIGLYTGETEKLSPVTRQIRAEIERRVSDPTFSLSQYLKRLPLNYDYVRKLMKSETGTTPREYLTGKRMNLAESLVLCRMENQFTEYSVSQLAEACGYSDPLYFSRVFKQYFGVSPSDYN